MYLIKAVECYAPEHLGRVDILIGGGKVLGVAEKIDPPRGLDCAIVDGAGLVAAPGFIDGHVHIAGAGGDGGPETRTPEVLPKALAEAGTTSCVGCLGTDGFTRTVGSVVMKAKSLRAQGLSSFCYTGSYQVPAPTLTGGVETDLCYLAEVIGVGEVAVSDHRSSSPTTSELLKLGKAAHVGGLLGGKAGIIHVHMGDGADPFRPIYDAVEAGDLPISKFYPTHVNRNDHILEDAKAFGKHAPVDITVGAGPDEPPKAIGATAWDAVIALLAAEVPLKNITLSSDACGSLPVYDENGTFVSMQVAQPRVLLRTFQKIVRDGLLPAEKALALITSNPARILQLSGKGRVMAGGDADILLFGKNWDLQWVFANGVPWMQDGDLIRTGTFG
ncbi:beta-aspartyl-peptidase [Hwanghaeella sp.]|uniref:beta-aspartyl-peptidase n=1 Tax=Hwanghaeella sp. TaxID=2605943 RepID=UPI003CCBD210